MEQKKVALITGITGQDGSYLAELLLEKGYDVHGTIRRSSVDYRERIAHLEGKPNFHLHYADLGDSMSIIQVMNKVKPTEVYNLAAQSHVQVSFDSPEFTADVGIPLAKSRWHPLAIGRVSHRQEYGRDLQTHRSLAYQALSTDSSRFLPPSLPDAKVCGQRQRSSCFSFAQYEHCDCARMRTYEPSTD